MRCERHAGSQQQTAGCCAQPHREHCSGKSTTKAGHTITLFCSITVTITVTVTANETLSPQATAGRLLMLAAWTVPHWKR